MLHYHFTIKRITVNKQLNRTVDRDDLKDHALHAFEIDRIFGPTQTIAWTALARYDGTLALQVLTDEEYRLIANALVAEGLPPEQVAKPEGLVEVLVAVAHFDCPKGEWYDASLVSAVACAKLLSLTQQAWGYDEAVAKANESVAFAKVLGVKP